MASKVTYCVIMSLMYISSLMSLLTLFQIAIDRVVAISMALKYKTLITRSRAKMVIIVSWFIVTVYLSALTSFYLMRDRTVEELNLILTASNAVGVDVYFRGIAVPVVICVAGSLITYGVIYVKLIRQESQREQLTSQGNQQEKKITKVRTNIHYARFTLAQVKLAGKLLV